MLSSEASATNTLWQHAWIPLCLFVAILLTILYTKLSTGLRSIPGPLLAAISPIDRLLTAASGHQFQFHLKYHQKYGKLVRVGPNHVSISDAEMIPKVYNIGSKFYKSDFYKMFDVRDPQTGKLVAPTIFSTRSEAVHKNMKRQVVHAYSTTSMKDFEPMVDVCTEIFQSKLLQFAERGEPFDLGEWLHWFAFDVISSITFSNRLGFMESEQDINGIISAIEGRLMYNSVVGQAPYLDNVFLRNPIFAFIAPRVSSFFAHLNSASSIVGFAKRQLDRYAQVKGKATDTDDKNDMLARFKRFRDGEQVMTGAELLSHASSNVFAGSDTTATTLRATIFNLCKNPRCMAKAVGEIDDMDSRGELSDPITFAEAQNMPYLQSCIKEALRIHPVVGQLLERVVPEGGAEISGTFLPAGVVVGVNPWVSARDQDVYGDDCNTFRPERWLEAEAEGLRLMERNNLAFGSGTRTCLGKNVSLFEMSKLIPQVLRRFEIELVNPEAELKISSYWFVLQKGLICRVKKR